MEESSYRLALNCLPQMGPATFRRLLQSLGSAAARAIHNGIVGIEIRSSMIRWMSMSAAPP